MNYIMIGIYENWQGWHSKSEGHSIPEGISKNRADKHFPNGCKESHALGRQVDQNTPKTPVIANIF